MACFQNFKQRLYLDLNKEVHQVYFLIWLFSPVFQPPFFFLERKGGDPLIIKYKFYISVVPTLQLLLFILTKSLTYFILWQKVVWHRKSYKVNVFLLIFLFILLILFSLTFLPSNVLSPSLSHFFSILRHNSHNVKLAI